MRRRIILFLSLLLVAACAQQMQPTQPLTTVETTLEVTLEVTAEVTEIPAVGQTDSGIFWHREGGIAGFCDDLNIYPDGDLIAYTCSTQPSSEVAMGSLTAEQSQQVNLWLEQYQAFTYEQRDPATADAMTVRVIFNGTGAEAAPEIIQQLIALFAQEVFLTLQTR